ncbi:hypothetical protein BITS_1652 [Bifidobacterium tsurumiense]|uniref:Uncharacterized protein n=1 Tax=Bifidobacterium tsurumiense TaxID=356829 RepID=A0A087EBG6_9BIFI|nr:hypothetical protein BITS_1652 [Bifidobacterium tsurumiense]
MNIVRFQMCFLHGTSNIDLKAFDMSARVALDNGVAAFHSYRGTICRVDYQSCGLISRLKCHRFLLTATE